MTTNTITDITWRGMVVFGDSVAQGCDDPGPDGAWIGWAERLAGRLELPPGHVLNVAGRGAKLADVVRDQLPVVRHLRPRLVMLNCGMNDALHGFEQPAFADGLAEIFGWARETGATAIAAAVPVAPLMDRSIMSEFRKRRTLQRVQDINEELSRGARAFGATFLGNDAMPEVTDPALWSSDGIHLNSAGHAYVAKVADHFARRAFMTEPPARRDRLGQR